jgi:hypothetical protein
VAAEDESQHRGLIDEEYGEEEEETDEEETF